MLDNLIVLIREREQGARKLKAMTGETRVTALVLGLFTSWIAWLAGACALLGLVQAMPDARAIALAAQGLSVVALALLGPGAYSMDALFFGRRIVRIDE